MLQIFTDLITTNVFPAMAMLFITAVTTINYQKNRIKKYQRTIYARMLANDNYRLLIYECPKMADRIYFKQVEPKIKKMAIDFFDANLTDEQNFDQTFINTYLS